MKIEGNKMTQKYFIGKCGGEGCMFRTGVILGEHQCLKYDLMLVPAVKEVIGLLTKVIMDKLTGVLYF